MTSLPRLSHPLCLGSTGPGRCPETSSCRGLAALSSPVSANVAIAPGAPQARSVSVPQSCVHQRENSLSWRESTHRVKGRGGEGRQHLGSPPSCFFLRDTPGAGHWGASQAVSGAWPGQGQAMRVTAMGSQHQEKVGRLWGAEWPHLKSEHSCGHRVRGESEGRSDRRGAVGHEMCSHCLPQSLCHPRGTESCHQAHRACGAPCPCSVAYD